MEDKTEKHDAKIKDLFKKTNYEQQPFFKKVTDQHKKLNMEFEEAVDKINQHIDEFQKKFGILADVFEIKEKYKTSFSTCIETEIYPIIEDKINIKLTK